MRTAKRFRTALLAICLSAGLIGCAHSPKVVVLDPNTTVTRQAKGQAFSPACDGYFVPDSTMLRILDQLGDKDVFGGQK